MKGDHILNTLLMFSSSFYNVTEVSKYDNEPACLTFIEIIECLETEVGGILKAYMREMNLIIFTLNTPYFPYSRARQHSYCDFLRNKIYISFIMYRPCTSQLT